MYGLSGRGPEGPGTFGGRMADSTKNRAGYVAAEVMARAGVRRLYTVPGESFLEILDAAEEHPDKDRNHPRRALGRAGLPRHRRGMERARVQGNTIRRR